MAVSLSLTHSSPVRRGRAAFIALWAVQIGLAGMFLLAGGSKLLGATPMVALFHVIGIGQWFRYVTGLIEVGSAVALLMPSFAVFGALALVPTMIGAILAQLLVVGDSAVPPAVLLVGAAVVIWVRRDELPMRRPTVR
jgi:putative oxidoreductase